MRRPRPAVRRTLLLLLTAPVLACGGPEPGAEAPPVVHLLDHLPEVPAAADRVLFALPEPDFPGAAWAGVSDVLDSHLLLRAEVVQGPVTLRLARVPGPLPPPDQWPAHLERNARPAHVAALDEGAGVLEARLPRRRADGGPMHVLYGVYAPGGAAAVARLTLERVPEHQNAFQAAVYGMLPGDGASPAVGRVNLAGDHRRALVLPAGSEQGLELEVPGSVRYLEWASGALAGLDPRALAPLRLQVTAEAEGLPPAGFDGFLNPAARLDDAFWQPGRLELGELAGRRVRFTFRARGEAGHALAVAHPRLASPGAHGGRPNVLLVSVDTLRADRLGCIAGDGGHTPRLDALAARGLLYTQAASTAPYTLPAHGSLFTGQHPLVHGAVDEHDALRASRPGGGPLLARALREAGWTTAAFTGGGYLSPDYGFAEGFDRYGIHDPLIHASELVERPPAGAQPRSVPPADWPAYLKGEAAHRSRAGAVGRWLGEHADRPFFLFLHTFAAHNYGPPPELLRAVCGADCASDWGSGRELRPRLRPEFWQSREIDAADREHLRHVYDAAVRHADAELGRVLDALAEHGLTERTLVVVTSDHGEEFFEHGIFGHSRNLHENLLRVPLILAGPGVPAGRVDAPVSLIDVAPTLLERLGLPADPRMQGRPLPLPGAPAPEDRPVLAAVDISIARGDSLRLGPWKLIRDRGPRAGPGEDGTGGDAGRLALYDLQADAGELRDLAPDRPELRDQLAERLGALRKGLEELEAALGQGASAELSETTRSALRDLGYFGED